ncbi:membrane protein [methanotrophic bacterial endosymbiont of Bathymodiolus sp.]|nr:membrane protein [methanotrophic bacterial endosymbiont of Bathymodiolus sp.]
MIPITIIAIPVGLALLLNFSRLCWSRLKNILILFSLFHGFFVEILCTAQNGY